MIPPFTSQYEKGYMFSYGYNPCAMTREDKFVIYIEGGVAPYDWEVTGSDFSFDDAQTATQYNFINCADDAVVGTVEEITVTDAAGTEVTGTVSCCGPDVCCDNPDYEFKMDHGSTAKAIHRGNSGRVAVIGGCAPFTWASDNEDFVLRRTFTNARYNYVTVKKDAVELDTGIISVSDGCGNTADRTTTATGPDGDVEVEDAIVVPPDDADWSCYSHNYNFFFTDEEPDSIDEQGQIEIAVTGGIPPYFWHSTTPTVLSFTNGDNTDDYKVTVGVNGGDLVTMYAEGCGSAAVMLSDGCIRSPIHPTGVGTVSVYVWCCCDEEPDAFELDTDNTPGIVQAGSSILVYILGGCPPFEWGDQGEGAWGVGPGYYRWENETTTARVNRLYAGGGCSGLGAYCTFDITDHCDTTCSPAGIAIHLDTAIWDDWADACVNGIGCAVPKCCDPGYEDFTGKYKYRGGDWQDGASDCAQDCCDEGIALVTGSDCWFKCTNDDCLREGTAGGGFSVEIRWPLKVNSSELVCPP